jgi:hypothetical protein
MDFVGAVRENEGMYPRFSITALLWLTAYAALTIAGFLDPLSFWSRVQFYFWCAVVLRFAVNAATPAGPQSTFARGFVLFVLLYFAASYLEHPGNQVPMLPHNMILRWVNDGYLHGNYEAYINCRRSLLVTITLAFGAVGGTLARWQEFRRA